MDLTPISERKEHIVTAIVDAAYSVHSNLRLGLLEGIDVELFSTSDNYADFLSCCDSARNFR